MPEEKLGGFNGEWIFSYFRLNGDPNSSSMRKMKILEQPYPTAVSVPRVVRKERGLVVSNFIVFFKIQLNSAMFDHKIEYSIYKYKTMYLQVVS